MYSGQNCINKSLKTFQRSRQLKKQSKYLKKTASHFRKQNTTEDNLKIKINGNQK